MKANATEVTPRSSRPGFVMRRRLERDRRAAALDLTLPASSSSSVSSRRTRTA